MNGEKVKLPKEVARAIQGQVNDDWTTIQIMRQAVRKEMMTVQNEPICEFANSDSGLETLMNALVNGFEVEETPEEKVREYYAHNNGEARNIIKITLNMLNIKIEGVNTYE